MHIKQRVAELASQRDRTDKPKLSAPERIKMLDEIYDGLLYLWKQAVITATAKGTSAIAHQLEKARLELDALARTHAINSSVGNDIVGWGHVVDAAKSDSADA